MTEQLNQAARYVPSRGQYVPSRGQSCVWERGVGDITVTSDVYFHLQRVMLFNFPPNLLLELNYV
jgi:hypothetical protein